MRTLSSKCSDEDIRALVVEWWELVAAGKYEQAFDLLPCHDVDGIVWTPETLEEGIATGCCMSPPRGVPRSLHAPGVEPYTIEVDREHLFGLDPKRYCGMVHFEPLPMDPLKPYPGSLTARFNIMKVGRDNITLEFLDAHVM